MYCFCHGYNISHIGVDCKVMICDASYTTAQKAAQAPALIDGRQGRN
jgi:hypothetical protein